MDLIENRKTYGNDKLNELSKLLDDNDKLDRNSSFERHKQQEQQDGVCPHAAHKCTQRGEEEALRMDQQRDHQERSPATTKWPTHDLLATKPGQQDKSNVDCNVGGSTGD